MTISVTDYFKTRKADRKKETRYLAVINKDSCTSCNSCATQCPVDCIYEVTSRIPSESYHQIDTSRCIGCQMCYRVPGESNDHYNLEICPWNAIDMLHNPNVKPSDVSALEPYYRGSETDLHWPKLEEYAYQFFLDGEVFLPVGEEELIGYMKPLSESVWFLTPDENAPLIVQVEGGDDFVRFRATEEGRAILDAVFDEYNRIFLD